MNAKQFQNMRNEFRIKLFTGCTKLLVGRGGAPIPESCADERKPGLVEMWPQYLTSERAASKPTLSLPDVAAMLEHRETPKYNTMVPRLLTDAEVTAIQAWYDAAKREEADTIGQELSTVQTNIMAQASTHRDENVNLHEATQQQVAALEERMSARVGLFGPKAALRGVVNRYAFVYTEFGNFYEAPSGSVVRSGRSMGQEGQEKRCRLVWVAQQVTSEPHLYYCEDEAGLAEIRSWSDFHHFSKNIQVKMKEACKPALPQGLRVLQGLKACIVQEDGEDLLIEMAHYKPDQPTRKSQNSIEKKRYKIKKAHVKFLRPDDDMEDNPGDGKVDDDNLEAADNASKDNKAEAPSCSNSAQKTVRRRIKKNQMPNKMLALQPSARGPQPPIMPTMSQPHPRAMLRKRGQRQRQQVKGRQGQRQSKAACGNWSISGTQNSSASSSMPRCLKSARLALRMI